MLQRYRSSVLEKLRLDDNIIQLKLKLIAPGQLEFEAGQYVLLNVPKEDGSIALKHFSIVNSIDIKDHVVLVAKIIHRGIASSYIETLKVGQQVIFQAPAGLFIYEKSPRDKIFIATSTGIAPLRSMIESHISNSKDNFYLFWGLRHLKDVYYLEELKALAARHSNFRFFICLSKNEEIKDVDGDELIYFGSGRVNSVLDEFILHHKYEIKNGDYYICGGRDAVEELRQYLYRKGIPKAQVFFEKF